MSKKNGQMPGIGIAAIYSEDFRNRGGTLESICSKPFASTDEETKAQRGEVSCPKHPARTWRG